MEKKVNKTSLMIGSILGAIIQILSMFIPPVGDFWSQVIHPNNITIEN